MAEATPTTAFVSGDPDTLAHVNPEELASLKDVAELLGVTRRTAQRYIERPELKFPEPLGRTATGRIWRRSDVEAWGETHLPLPTGRPPKAPGSA